MTDIYERTVAWNPWHGCHRVSSGCLHCYMFEGNKSRGIENSNTVIRSKHQFNLPLKKGRNGCYVLRNCLITTSMSSDFFIKEADVWRDEAWSIIRKRSDLVFEIITKRPERINSHLPDDWKDGYDNVRLAVSIENQDAWDTRIPIIQSVKAKHRDVFMAPMIGRIDTDTLLKKGNIDAIFVGGEYCSEGARPCHYDWVLDVRRSCIDNNVSFHWRNCGTYFVKDGIQYYIPNIADQSKIACSGNLDYMIDPIIGNERSIQQTNLDSFF